MICIPGLTVVDLRAMSVSRLISIPGDTSIESDASPASGRKPWATVPRNAAYCAWRLSRKTYARRSILPMRDLLSRDDLDAGRGPDPGRAGRDHVLHVLRRPDPAGRLDAHLRADRLAHEGNVEDGRPSLRVAGRGLDEVGLRLLRQAAGDDLLGVGEERRLDDHLVRRAGLVAGVSDACHESGAANKVIIETALLTDAEKVVACRLAQQAKADFIKTSTGYAKGGATVFDVALMRETVGPKMGVKAAGGIRTAEDVQDMIAAGATRIGASAGVKIVTGEKGAHGHH